MKKVLMVAAMLFVGVFTYCYAQDVRVNINNQDYSSNKDCDFTINGICSSEDIGGVDVEFISEYNDRYYIYSVKFTNYNTFPTTVLAIIQHELFSGSYEERTMNIVLGANGTKTIPLSTSGRRGSVNGIIVRKLAQ